MMGGLSAEEDTTPEEEVPAKEEEKPATAAEDEVKKFIRWLRKGHPTRPFEFKELEETYAEVINKFIETGDIDSARWYAEHYLGL